MNFLNPKLIRNLLKMRSISVTSATLLCALAAPKIASGAVIITLAETPGGVSVDVSGSIQAAGTPIPFSNLTSTQSSLVVNASGSQIVGIGEDTNNISSRSIDGIPFPIPDLRKFTMGRPSVVSTIDTGITGFYQIAITRFGPGPNFVITTPTDYVLGTPISESGLYPGETLQSLGLAADLSETIVYPIDFAGGTDSFTFNTISVPEPSTTSCILLGLGVYALRRSRKSNGAKNRSTPLAILVATIVSVGAGHAAAPSELLEKPILFGNLQYDESFGLILTERERVLSIPRFGLLPGTPLGEESKFRNSRGDRLPFPSDGALEKPILALRIQKDLTGFGPDREPAMLTWQQDRLTDSTSALAQAALILDLYSPGFAGIGSAFRYDPTGMAFRVSGGIAWDRNDAAGDNGRDVRSFLLGADFDYLPTILGKGSRQPGSFNLIYEEDTIGGTSRFHLDLDWAPVFGTTPTGPEKGTFWIGRRNYYQGFFDFIDGTETLRIEDEKTADPAGRITTRRDEEEHYFYFRPDVALEIGGGGSLGDAITAFDQSFLRYGINTGFGFHHDLIKLTYTLEGRQPFSSDQESHLHQKLSLRFESRATPLAITASYQRGEISPTFVKEDLVTIGLSLKL